jgi:hypothetical protein
MLHKCANPACASAFRSLRHGKLFLLETELWLSAWVWSVPRQPERATGTQG